MKIKKDAVTGMVISRKQMFGVRIRNRADYANFQTGIQRIYK